MKITKPEIHRKVWGNEEWIVNREYCGKLLNLKKGFRCSIHHHKIKDETFYILRGKVLIEIADEKKIMNPGEVLIIEPGTKHRFTGHHEYGDSHRDTQSSKVNLNELNLGELE